MNERIEELYNKALEQHYSNNMAWEDLNIEKFAELIILECVDRIKNADMTDLEGSDPDDVLWLVERQIVKHFGVD
jgi:hypothetical protein